jgi:beta-glucosidase
LPRFDTSSISRRTFARIAAATAGLAPFAARDMVAQSVPVSTPVVPADRLFPNGFRWGSATASYQVEGAYREDGRGMSIWDTFSHTPGKVAKGDTGDVADDSYHRYKTDIALMKDLGLTTCRFSIAWTRIFPNAGAGSKGNGEPNQKGLDHYYRFVDELLANGIEPYCTLYHWDLPQALEDQGGWKNRATAQHFAEYAGYTAGKLGDRVQHFMTMNEIQTFVELGYRLGTHAPGLKLDAAGVAQVNHHAVLGHGLAVQAIRAATPSRTRIGLADNVSACTPAIETPEHIAATRLAMREENASYLTVILEGRYTERYLKRLGAAAPHFTAEDLKAISSPMDFVGLNIYTPTYIRASASEKGYEVIPVPKSYPHMASSWLNIGPEALYWSPKLVSSIWGVKELYITENGASANDVLTPKGEVLDTDRVMYLRNYLTQLQRATAEGVPVKGYFCWSLLDNFEWADGYEKRFGLTYVDFATEKRTPKLSSEFYRAMIRRNGLV